MKALSVKQPWAELEAAGIKIEEIRGAQTHYRGLLAIHASLRDDTTPAAKSAWAAHRPPNSPTAINALPRGCIVAIVNLTDCRPFQAGHLACIPWRPDAYAWRLEDARRVDSVLPVKGRLGLWECPDSLIVESQEAAHG